MDAIYVVFKWHPTITLFVVETKSADPPCHQQGERVKGALASNKGPKGKADKQEEESWQPISEGRATFPLRGRPKIVKGKPGGAMPSDTYIPTYLYLSYRHTCLPISLPYLTLPYLTSHHITSHYITLAEITLDYITLLTYNTHTHTNLKETLKLTRR